MSNTSTIINYAVMKVKSICEEQMGKPIPNWFNIEDMQGFAFRITEGDLNLLNSIVVYPVDEAGPGHFLVKLQSTFTTAPAVRQGYEFMPAPLGVSIEMDYPLYAETEEELQAGILVWLSDEIENILNQILE